MVQTPKINLIHGDCMDLMRETSDGYYDLAVIDPEYGIDAANMTMGSGKNKRYKKSDWDKQRPDSAYFKEVFRVSKNQIVCGGNYFTDLLPPTKSWILWDKGIYGDCSFADGEMIWTSFDSVLRIAQIRYKGFLGADKERIHITQKPVALYKWLLTNYAKPGDRILDTHGGSMSISIACYDLGFDLDLTELDKDYYDAGVARFERHRAQGQLFHAPATQLPEQQKMF